jgi:hypothetical protein
MTGIPAPNGYCWCDCGGETTDEARFLPGHDKVAEAKVIKLHYGTVARFLVHHGYGPDGKDLETEFDKWERKGKRRP